MHDKAPGITHDSAAIISVTDVQFGLKVQANINSLCVSGSSAWLIRARAGAPCMEEKGRLESNETLIDSPVINMSLR